MSAETVETLQIAYDAFNRGECGRALTVFAPDAESSRSDGQMSREEFERTVTLELEGGRMDPGDAEAARGVLG